MTGCGRVVNYQSMKFLEQLHVHKFYIATGRRSVSKLNGLVSRLGFQQGMASLFAYPLLLFVMDYKLGRIYARTNAAFIDRRGLGSRL